MKTEVEILESHFGSCYHQIAHDERYIVAAMKEHTSLVSEEKDRRIRELEEALDIRLGEIKSQEIFITGLTSELHNRIMVQWEKDFGSIHSSQPMDAYTVSGFVKSALNPPRTP